MKISINQLAEQKGGQNLRNVSNLLYRIFRVGLATLLVFYFTLIISSNPVSTAQAEKIDKVIELLEQRGFSEDVFWLRRVTLFRNSDNWLNSLAPKENAFAATNCPFGIITIYPDFYNKATDDTERAMILLHEAQHLRGADERESYSYVWRNRQKLGWTITSHGTTETFVTIELQTRENAPELFACSEKLWNDCTEKIRIAKK